MDVVVHSASMADDLGCRAQSDLAAAITPQGVAQYRIVGGHMVRLLLVAHPTRGAVARATLDADAGLGSVALVGPVVRSLLDAGYRPIAANSLVRRDGARRLQVDILVPSDRSTMGVHPVDVEGVGSVDALPALSLVMQMPPVVLNVTAHLLDGETLRYSVPLPPLDMALPLKAMSWYNRRQDKDVVDIATLLEIRHEHQELDWSFGPDASLKGRRLDAARALHQLDALLGRGGAAGSIPQEINRPRLRALIRGHVAKPD